MHRATTRATAQRLRLRRGLSTAAAKAKSGSVVLPVLGVASVGAGAYAGLALYADSDSGFKAQWIEHAQFTGGQRGIDLVVEAKKTVLGLEPEKVRAAAEARAADLAQKAIAVKEQAEAKADEAKRAIESAKNTVTDTYSSAVDSVAKVQASATSTYESTVETITSAQKKVEETANSAFETIESIRASIFGPSSTPVPPPKSVPSLPTPPPKPTTPVTEVKKEEPKKVAANAVEKTKKAAEVVAVAPVVVSPIVSEVPEFEEINDTPIDFTPNDDHKFVVVATPIVVPAVAVEEPVSAPVPTPSGAPVKQSKKESKKDKKEKKEAVVDASTPVLASVIAESTLPSPLAAQLESLSKSLDSIKPTTKNSAALKEAKEALIALAKSIPSATSSSEVSEADIHNALEAQAERFIETIGKQNELALQALTEHERELGEVFELALQDQAAALLAEKAKALADLQAQKDRDFEEALHAALVKESEEIKKEWTAKVKQLVDNERDGRLARLDHLAIKLKHLEAISINSGEYVERMQGIQRVIAALQGVALKVEEGGPFKKEFGVLQKVGKGDAVVEAVLATVDTRAVEEGVVSVDELRQDFETLSTKLRRVQLMPENGGPFSYGVSYLLSYLLISKNGLAAGNDTESILARAKFYLQHGDLESATREINQLQGWSKVLARDWLKEARAHLEVKQALETVESHISLKNLGAV
ncbi:UNVERIFIED_CONTAM: Formation of crista junctions protein 1 [Siphonaria sp. JEL0065]|nr:Formation of crista junctions protein 1 [Siphonaria sp. JEL0065]